MRRVSPRRLLALTLLAGLALGPRLARGEDTVSLRPRATAPEGRPLTLADVADLTGDEAARVGGVEVGASGSEVTLADVRRALEKAGANLGRLRLRGGACALRVAAPEAPDGGVAPGASVPAAGPGEPSVRDAVAYRIAQMLTVEPTDLRLAWQESDGALLNTPTTGRRVVVDPTGEGDRVPLAVRVYEGDRVAAHGLVRVGVEVRREVLVATAAMARGAVLAPDAVVREQRWLSPSMAAAGEGAIGQVVRGRIGAGEVVLGRDVEPPMVARRGDVVSVDCLAGGLVVRTTARATENGREGEVITLQALNSKRTFRARMDGPGRAVLLADGPAERIGR